VGSLQPNQVKTEIHQLKGRATISLDQEKQESIQIEF
jgi:hypothetical protein